MSKMETEIDSDGSFGVPGAEDGVVSELAEGRSMNADAQKTGEIVAHVQITNKMGLHARPAMQFVDLANKFDSKVRVCKGEQSVNAKSIMELLLLAASEGTELAIRAEGPDADSAIDALSKLVENGFDEE